MGKKVYQAINPLDLAKQLGGSQEEVILKHMSSVRDYSKPLDFRSKDIYNNKLKTTKDKKEKDALEKMLKEDLEFEKVLIQVFKENDSFSIEVKERLVIDIANMREKIVKSLN